jgi:hypothetical protein
MNLSVPYATYLEALKGQENAPASLRALLAPFGIQEVPAQEDEFLLVGHILDALAAETLQTESVQPEGILELALDLGMSTSI